MLQSQSLKPFNTLGIAAIANYLLKVQTLESLQILIKNTVYQQLPKFVLGGGSNVLFTKDFEGIILKNELLGKEIIQKKEGKVQIKVAGGENWHEFVLWCVEQGFGGIENLSLIPGTVGAAPIQNIGAYGVELKDVFVALEAVDLSTGEISVFDKATCQFGYRDSIFKQHLRGKYFISSVTFSLTTKNHQISTKYGAIRSTLERLSITNPTIKDISNAVVSIRSSKLPDPKILGNAGSFFKNPEISRLNFQQLQQEFQAIVFYDLPNGKVKIPAGWLIEQCGWKGKVVGNTGSYHKQALVLVNYGNATGQEVLDVAEAIIKSVKEKFKIELSPEVNIL